MMGVLKEGRKICRMTDLFILIEASDPDPQHQETRTTDVLYF
jgi:hypothetical protein